MGISWPWSSLPDQSELVDFGSAESIQPGKILWQGQEQLGDYTQQLAGDCPAGVMALVHQSFNHPMEIETGAVGKWHDLTHVNAQVTAPFKVQSLKWKDDEFNVQGWLVMPEAAPSAAKLPLVTIVHGGPHQLFSRLSSGPDGRACCSKTAMPSFYPTLAAATAKGELCDSQRA
jgi:hypothetical protein